MELGDLDKLTSAELRKLITLMARQTTLVNYKHTCETQRKCTSCNKWLCYACYNLHLAEIHGEHVAHFNERLDNSINIIQEEKKETKIKIKTKTTIKIVRSERENKLDASPRERKLNSTKRKEQTYETPLGQLTKDQILELIELL